MMDHRDARNMDAVLTAMARQISGKLPAGTAASARRDSRQGIV